MMEDKKLNTYTFNVEGMHCNACEFLINDILADNPKVKNVKASLKDKTVTVETKEENKDELMNELSSLIKENGYTLSNRK